MEEIKDSKTIQQVQQKLKQQGEDVETDGSLGPKTKKALKQFQQDQGMQPSGSLDKETATALGVEPQQQ